MVKEGSNWFCRDCDFNSRYKSHVSGRSLSCFKTYQRTLISFAVFKKTLFEHLISVAEPSLFSSAPAPDIFFAPDRGTKISAPAPPIKARIRLAPAPAPKTNFDKLLNCG